MAKAERMRLVSHNSNVFFAMSNQPTCKKIVFAILEHSSRWTGRDCKSVEERNVFYELPPRENIWITFFCVQNVGWNEM